ncbi:HIT family protein [Brachybacterium halotolerans subsp. kimchii]|uniref:HIT family protein n=1 Tax=Brachybacterium halotolerans TaxID=2795215 RepID=UPI001E4D95EB|nr:HIT family protein [Brachybacterium halotolerans]UEJ83434.1 HIT family protein [Brachybacterium halotolerans subsp. kimchii]
MSDPSPAPDEHSPTSVFLEVPAEERVAQNSLVFALRDTHPVSPGHTLIIPFRPIVTWFDAAAREWAAAWDLVDRCKDELDSALAPDGYNVGFNAGRAAGQTVPHAHLHLIPRFAGDVQNPAGGVRHAVIGRGFYE